jgi:hypothetical protein
MLPTMYAPAYRFAGSRNHLAIFRALSTEPGFLDSGGVSERVLEVVRKFEKVSRHWTLASCSFGSPSNP